MDVARVVRGGAAGLVVVGEAAGGAEGVGGEPGEAGTGRLPGQY
ncbi:hypothetical protein [Streptomyces sp. NPDC002587]